MDDAAKAIVAVSTSPPEVQSQISSLVEAYCERLINEHRYDCLVLMNTEICQQLQQGMQDTLKMASEIEQSSIEITQEVEKCKESADVKSKLLEEDKVGVQKAIFTVLQILDTDAI